jgi:hypothetical protein
MEVTKTEKTPRRNFLALGLVIKNRTKIIIMKGVILYKQYIE